MAIFWFLCGGKNIGSARIHGYQIHDFLRRQGFPSRLALTPPDDVQIDDVPWGNPENVVAALSARRGDSAVFETVRGVRACMLAQCLRKRGVRVIFSECDIHSDLELARQADEIVCSSLHLSSLYQEKLMRSIVTIEDSVEYILPDVEMKTRTRNNPSSFTLCWVGNQSHWRTLDDLRGLLREKEFAEFRLVTVSDHPDAVIKWSRQSAKKALASCDAAVIPTSVTAYAQAKSNNRVTQAMALGAPVLAGRIPAYVSIIEPGKNGFLCSNSSQWANALRLLRDDARRRAMSYAAHQLVKDRYTLDILGPQWLKSICGPSSGVCEIQHDKVEHVKLWRRERAEQQWRYASALRGRGKLLDGIVYALSSLVLDPRRIFAHRN